MRGLSRIRLQCSSLEERVVPTTYTVNTLADVIADDGVLSLREALQAANENLAINEAPAGTASDVINFAVPTGSILTVYGGPLVIWSTVTIQGTVGNLTLDAAKLNRLFDIRIGATVTLNRLTMINGHASNLSFPHGGAIDNDGTLTLNNCLLRDNRSEGMGGAIANDGTLTIRNSLLANNRSEATGLASAGFGGAITNNGSVTIENSTLSGNFASNQGGAIHNNFGATGLTITNATITNNRVDGNFGGGGIGGSSTNNGTATAVLKNTIVHGNSSGFASDDIKIASGGSISGNNNLIGVNVNGVSTGNGNQIGIEDAMLGPLSNNGGQTETHALLAGSPAINVGDSSVMTNIVYDQRSTGYIRNFGVRDIGSFEFQPAPDVSLVVTEAGDTVDHDFSNGKLTLREAIGAANARLGADTITFAPTITDIILTQDQLVLSDDVTIDGSDVTVRRSNVAGPFRLFSVDSGVQATLRGLTLTGGESLANGGAILNAGQLTLRQMSISDNYSYGTGGAISNSANSDLRIEHSTISTNETLTKGGGVHNSGRLIIEHTRLINNAAAEEGGGINNTGTLSLSNSTLANNSGLMGGGLSSAGPVSMSNSTLSGNHADTTGGGIHSSGRLTVVNTTITKNHSDYDNNMSGTGGGLHVASAATALFNTIVADNYRGSGTTLEDDISGTINARSTNNLIGTGGAGGLTHGINANRVGITDPMLQPLSGGTMMVHQPLTGSPALDGGERRMVVVPLSATSSTSADDQVAASQLLNTGLSSTPTIANLATITHNTNSAHMWTTANRNGTDDYFGKSQANPSVTFALGGNFELTGIVLWGLNGNKNEGKSFRVEFSTDYGATFGNAFNFTHETIMDAFGRETTFLQPHEANVVRLTITDNFHDGTTDGNRVGLGEVRFLGTTGTSDQRGSSRTSGSDIDIGAVEVPVLFEDDFVRPDARTPGSPWRTQTGVVTISSEQLVGGSVKVNIATIEGLAVSDVDVNANVQLLSGQSLKLLARYNGPADRNYYAALLEHDGVGLRVAIQRNVNGKTDDLNSTIIPAATNVRLLIRGNRITIDADQQEILVAIDNTFATGRLGIAVSNDAHIGMVRAYDVEGKLDLSASFDLDEGAALGDEWLTVLGSYQSRSLKALGQTSSNMAIVAGARAADVDLSASVEVQSATGNYAGLVARYSGNGNRNYYLGQIIQTARGPFAQIIRNVNGRVTTLKSVSVGSGVGQLRFLATGNQLRLLVNGVEVASSIDTTFTHGASGIRSDASSFIDQFEADVVTTALPYNDSFKGNGSLSDAWTTRVGSLTVQNDRVAAPVARVASHLATVVADPMAEGSASADVAVSLLNQRAGVVVRYVGVGDRNYYLGEVLQTKNGPIARLVKNNNGRLTILGSVELESGAVNLRLDAVGTVLRLYVNDELQLTAVDTTFLRGHVGIRTTGAGTVDHFEAVEGTTLIAWNATFTGTTGETVASTWAARNGSYEIYNNQAGGREKLNFAVLTGMDTANSLSSVNVQVGEASGEFASLAARVSGIDAANMYLATIRRVGTSYVAMIERKMGKTTTILASVVVNSGEGLLGFEVNGTHLKLTFGTTTLTASDALLTSGGVGLRSSLDVLFDNFSVTTL